MIWRPACRYAIAIDARRNRWAGSGDRIGLRADTLGRASIEIAVAVGRIVDWVGADWRAVGNFVVWVAVD